MSKAQLLGAYIPFPESSVDLLTLLKEKAAMSQKTFNLVEAIIYLSKDPFHRLICPGGDVLRIIDGRVEYYMDGVWEAAEELAEGTYRLSEYPTALERRNMSVSNVTDAIDSMDVFQETKDGLKRVAEAILSEVDKRIEEALKTGIKTVMWKKHTESACE